MSAARTSWHQMPSHLQRIFPNQRGEGSRLRSINLSVRRPFHGTFRKLVLAIDVSTTFSGLRHVDGWGYILQVGDEGCGFYVGREVVQQIPLEAD
ncbi:hypothetical protein A0H81_10514 [Grifola frondosa]|uniref:Uncharacterized protein n=1 Tax=Grifola frondosa TaxID=5627 RepID=A0A1C7LZ19_GRIFR|nr:hypothetical protein A0H81_10514 [Grifola frondosa]